MILLISASWVPRITGMSYWCLAWTPFVSVPSGSTGGRANTQKNWWHPDGKLFWRDPGYFLGTLTQHILQAHILPTFHLTPGQEECHWILHSDTGNIYWAIPTKMLVDKLTGQLWLGVFANLVLPTSTTKLPRKFKPNFKPKHRKYINFCLFLFPWLHF
jgi:hypothetical protein